MRGARLPGLGFEGPGSGERSLSEVLGLVAEWIHFTFFGLKVPTLKLKVYTFGGLMKSATKLEQLKYKRLRAI